MKIGTGDCASEEVVKALRSMESLGQEQYKNFVKTVIEDRTVSIHDTIKKNSLPLFKRQNPKPKSKSKQQVSALRSDCNLFSRLYIATQHRCGDLDEFFMHENQPYPPSLSEFGKLRFGKKSDLLTCVKPANTEQLNPPPIYDCKIFDGAAVVHVLPSTTVVTSRGSSDMQRCNHEEADTRIALHVQHALAKGCKQVFVRTVDTDVLIIFIGLFHDMIASCPSAAIWIGLGMGKYVQYISVNSTCAFLGPETSRALPMFHSFTGCDTTSCFFGKGKKSAWEAWKSFPDVTEAFTFLENHPYYQLHVDDSIFKLLERFTVVLYDKASNVLDVNEAHKEIFIKKNRTLENTPPTQVH